MCLNRGLVRIRGLGVSAVTDWVVSVLQRFGERPLSMRHPLKRASSDQCIARRRWLWVRGCRAQQEGCPWLVLQVSTSVGAQRT